MIMIINKKIFLIIFFVFFSMNCFSQIGIGISSVKGSALIDFAENTTNGMILPHVNDVDNMLVDTKGTIVFDEKSKKVKYFDGEKWISMNREEGKLSDSFSFQEYDVSQGVIIGNEKSDASGVLILESNDRALVLPKISDPAKNVTSPYPGMICYDTVSNNVYFFNGLVWEFWGH